MWKIPMTRLCSGKLIAVICLWLTRKNIFPWYKKCLRLAQVQGLGLVSFWWVGGISFLDFWMQNKKKICQGACEKKLLGIPTVWSRFKVSLYEKMIINITVYKKRWRIGYFSGFPLPYSTNKNCTVSCTCTSPNRFRKKEKAMIFLL